MTAEAKGSAEKFAPLSSEEQETVISWDRADRTARIYTTDRRYIGKLDKLYERKQIHRNADGITAIEYEVPEKLISFRSGVVKMNLTDEQRKKIGERLRGGRKTNA